MSNPVVQLDKRLADAFRQAIETTFQDSFQLKISVKDWSLDKSPVDLDPYIVCAIEMMDAETDKSAGALIVGFSRETIQKILKAYNVTEMADEKIMNDAAEELVNIMYGMVKTLLNKMGYAFKMGFPFTDREKMPPVSQGGNIEKMVMPFYTEGHECRLVFVQMI